MSWSLLLEYLVKRTLNLETNSSNIYYTFQLFQSQAIISTVWAFKRFTWYDGAAYRLLALAASTKCPTAAASRGSSLKQQRPAMNDPNVMNGKRCWTQLKILVFFSRLKNVIVIKLIMLFWFICAVASLWAGFTTQAKVRGLGVQCFTLVHTFRSDNYMSL